MRNKNPTVVITNEKVRMGECLSCGHKWQIRKAPPEIPKVCPRCHAYLSLREIKDEMIPLTDAHQKKRASTSQ